MPELAHPPPPPADAPDWDIEGADWPHREHSRFHRAGRYAWHVQRMGQGPPALLIHGTGASSHSWAGLMPLLASSWDVIALDLPGHGFTQAEGFAVPTLPNITHALAALLADLGVQPKLVIGHSAGAAIMVHLAATSRRPPTRLLSINGAFKPFPGLAGLIAPGLARALTVGGFVARMLANGAKDRGRVERLLIQTGAHPPAESVDRYATLLRRPAHIAGTLSMMANWDLSGIEGDLRHLESPILFLAGAQDQTVAPADAPRLAGITAKGCARTLPGLGHLAHEQAPGRIAELVREFQNCR